MRNHPETSLTPPKNTVAQLLKTITSLLGSEAKRRKKVATLVGSTFHQWWEKGPIHRGTQQRLVLRMWPPKFRPHVLIITPQ